MNILFVCTGNTCRSAMAEAVARRFIAQNPEQYGQFQVASAGVMCAGPSPASPQAVAVAEQNGCDLSQFTAKQITAELAEQADYIFVMTSSHKRMLDSVLPQCSAKTFLLNATQWATLLRRKFPIPSAVRWRNMPSALPCWRPVSVRFLKK